MIAENGPPIDDAEMPPCDGSSNKTKNKMVLVVKTHRNTKIKSILNKNNAKSNRNLL